MKVYRLNWSSNALPHERATVIDTNTRPSDTPPLACVPGAIPTGERAAHFALLQRLFGESAQERRDVPGGYAFRFDAASFDDVARFVELERLCCPFLTFNLDVSAQAGPLWLRLTGPEGTREFLDAELPVGATMRPAHCSAKFSHREIL
jgi:hypothetical protein